MSDQLPIPSAKLTLYTQQPVKTLFRNLKFDSWGFFKALSKAGGHLGGGKLWDLPADVVEGLATIKLESLQPEERAYLLFYRALLRGSYPLVAASIGRLRIDDLQLTALSQKFDAALAEKDIALTKDFFTRPARLEALTTFQDLIRQYLTEGGLEPDRAATVAERLPQYFTLGLHREWADRRAEYEPLRSVFETPFSDAVGYELAWLHYYEFLKAQVNEDMLNESFGLAKVYVPLRAYYEKKTKPTEPRSRTLLTPDAKIIRHVVDLHTHMDGWLQKRDKNDALRVLSGGPGSGKSSFSKMWAAKLAERGTQKLLYIPLHRLEIGTNLTDAVAQFLKDNGYLPRNPLDRDTKESNLLLLLDGLDEISERGKAAAELARNFVDKVEKILDQRNGTTCELQILLTGRDLAIQSSLGMDPQPGQTLHALPYKVDVPDTLSFTGDFTYQDPTELLAPDQRDIWWRQYGTARGKSYPGIPEKLKGELDAVTEQPLLNYLVALSYESGRLNFDAGVNLNEIYADLLHNVFEGIHNQGRNPAAKGLEESDFNLALQEIALAAWHNKGRTTTLATIEQYCQKANLGHIRQELSEAAQTNISNLLLAFYFRQYGKDTATGDSTFEFTHKSFGEYLTARRLVKELDEITYNLEEARKNSRFRYSLEDALKSWAETFGPTIIDDYIHPFLEREIALRCQQIIRQALEIELHCLHEGKDFDLLCQQAGEALTLKCRQTGKNLVHSWQQTVAQLMNAVVNEGLPMHQLSTTPTYPQMAAQARNAETALFILHSCCASITRECTTISWPEPVSAGDWIARLVGQRPNDFPPLLLRSIQRLDINNQSLFCHSLSGANLINADLRGADLINADLSGADLTGATLTGATLIGANLRGANLRGADLIGANLSGANLRDADLINANLRGADLRGANLSRADLGGADLSRANLSGANLSSANLISADFRGADLIDADLINANLSRADLINANLSRADLRGANLINADLRSADLSGANLRGADLISANLGRADLVNANLSRANLGGANLGGANLRGANLKNVKVGNKIVNDVESLLAALKEPDDEDSLVEIT